MFESDERNLPLHPICASTALLHHLASTSLPPGCASLCDSLSIFTFSFSCFLPGVIAGVFQACLYIFLVQLMCVFHSSHMYFFNLFHIFLTLDSFHSSWSGNHAIINQYILKVVLLV